MRAKLTTNRLFFLCGFLLMGLTVLLAANHFNLPQLNVLASFDQGGKSPIIVKSNASGNVQILDAVENKGSEFQLASIKSNSTMIQTASIREAVAMAAGPPCDVLDCAGTGMPFTISASGGCGGLIQEAENGTLSGFFATGTDTTASGGGYVHVPNGLGFRSSPDEAQKVSYCVTVTQAGTYRIKTNIHASSFADDSFHVKIDSLPSNGYMWVSSVNTAYATDYVADYLVEDPVEVTLSVGDHTIDFYLREDGTRLDKFELELVGSNCGGLIQEAESGLLNGLFTSGTDSAASGGEYVHVPNGLGFRGTPDEAQKASYCVTVPQAGTYRIKANIHAGNFADDSFHVRVDGAPSNGYKWISSINSTYSVDYVEDYLVEDPVEVTLSAGDHTIDFYLREDGTRLDKFELELVGSNCGGLIQEAEDGLLNGLFTSGTDSAASGGEYVHVPNGLGFRGTPDEAQKASYCVTVPQAGTYRIKANVHAGNHADNSFYVRVDGAPGNGYKWITSINNTYNVDYVADYLVEDPVEVTLSAGTHTIDFYLREDGTRLDKFELHQVVTAAALNNDHITKERTMTAAGIRGSLIIGMEKYPNNGEYNLDLSMINVSIVDAGTLGEVINYRTTTDRYGSYFIDDMPLGKYIIIPDLPAGHRLRDQQPVSVLTSADEVIDVPFEILIDASSEVEQENNSFSQRLYLPFIGN